VKFHNGDVMTAEDVIFSFWRYKAAQAKLIHGKTEKVEAVNPHHVRFQFKTPPRFLDYFLTGATSIAWWSPRSISNRLARPVSENVPWDAAPTSL